MIQETMKYKKSHSNLIFQEFINRAQKYSDVGTYCLISKATMTFLYYAYFIFDILKVQM